MAPPFPESGPLSDYRLELEDGSGRSRSVPLDHFPFTIGRDQESSLVLAEPSVSRRHASIKKEGEGLRVVDQESRNGVYVNDERIQKSRLLAPGDRLHIGSARLRLTLGAVPEAPSDAVGSQTIQYVPSRESWDPSKSLSVKLSSAQPGAGGGGPRVRNWQWMLPSLFLDAGLPEVYQHVLDVIQTGISFDRCFILLFEPGDPASTRTAAQRVQKEGLGEVIVSKDILRRVAESREAVVVKARDAAFTPSESFIQSGAASAICVPLIAGDKVSGVIYLDRFSPTADLGREEIEALGPLAGLAALKIQNLRLLGDREAAESLVRDLELAKSIQEGLLPQPVAVAGFSVDGSSAPCQQVGGDYFDFFRHGDGSLTFIIGDVSGKGLSAAMYMACVRWTIRAHLEDGLGLEELMARLERNIQTSFRPDHFLTLFVGRLRPQSGLLVYTNAGHLPPIGFPREGGRFELEVTDPALNVTEWGSFHCREHRMAPGELLLLYTDGLTEATNAGWELYGKDRLAASVASRRELPLLRLRQEVLSEIHSFEGDRSPGDDRTLILLRRELDSGPAPTTIHSH
jgi:sigma-B regulation protein RsbU (phosphoserine phosphatase)